MSVCGVCAIIPRRWRWRREAAKDRATFLARSRAPVADEERVVAAAGGGSTGPRMAEATFTFRVEEDLKAAFSDQTGAQLHRGFMRDYVKNRRDQAEYDAWFRRQVQAGLDSFPDR